MHYKLSYPIPVVFVTVNSNDILEFACSLLQGKFKEIIIAAVAYWTNASEGRFAANPHWHGGRR